MAAHFFKQGLIETLASQWHIPPFAETANIEETLQFRANPAPTQANLIESKDQIP